MIYWIHIIILEKVRSCLWILELWFWTYDWICLLVPSGQDLVSRPWAPRSRHFFEILWFYWIHIIILEKVRSCLWILEPGFWTCGWICLLGPSGPNLVSRPHAPRSRHFLKFYNFIGFMSSFLKKWGPVCEYWSQVLDLWVDMSSGPKWPKFSF